jgi:hypothetical protein
MPILNKPEENQMKFTRISPCKHCGRTPAIGIKDYTETKTDQQGNTQPIESWEVTIACIPCTRQSRNPLGTGALTRSTYGRDYDDAMYINHITHGRDHALQQQIRVWNRMQNTSDRALEASDRRQRRHTKRVNKRDYQRDPRVKAMYRTLGIPKP